jgi:hypothetical protein
VEESRKRVALYSTHSPAWIPPKGSGQQQHPAVAGDSNVKCQRPKVHPLRFVLILQPL